MRARTDEEVAQYRAQRQIHVYGEGVPKPCTTFDEASFPGMLQRLVMRSTVQRKAARSAAHGWPWQRHSMLGTAGSSMLAAWAG